MTTARAPGERRTSAAAATALAAYAIGGVRRRWRGHAVVGGVYALCVLLVAAGLLLAAVLRTALVDTVDALPDVTVQRLVGGRLATMPMGRLDALATLPGVTWASERVWGYHAFAPGGATFTFVGFDPWLPTHRAALSDALEAVDAERLAKGDAVVVGTGVRAVMREVFGEDADVLVLARPDGEVVSLHVAGTLDDATSLFANDLVLVPLPALRALIGLAEDEATDLVARVANPEEVETIARKIAQLWPDVRVVTRDDLARSYRATLDFGGGVLLGAGLVLLLAAFVLVYGRASSVGADERRELAILRAVGWRVSDVVAARLVESGFVALVATLAGLAGAVVWVHVLGAPGLLAVFTGLDRLRGTLRVPPFVDAGVLLTVGAVALALYVGAALVPAWRLATQDTDEGLR